MVHSKVGIYRAWIMLTALITVCACSIGAQATSIGKTKTSREVVNMSKDSAELKELLESYKSDFNDNVFDGRECFNIAGETDIDVNARKTAPLVVMWVAKLSEIVQTPFKNLTTLTAIRLEDSKVWSNPAFEIRKGSLPKFKPEMETALEGHSGVLEAIDARDRLGIEWRSGHYIFTALLRDQYSNRLAVEFKQGAGAWVDPEVESFINEHYRKPVDRTVWPPAVTEDLLPGYRERSDSPNLPEEGNAIVLACDRVITMHQSANGKLIGSFRLPIRVRDILSKPTDDGATAVLPITLIITGSDSRGATKIPLAVPVYDRLISGNENQIATGHFALDLLSLPMMPDEIQTYFIYAFYGEYMGGPVVMGLVSPDSLPR